jgi:FG-GAP repeat
MALAQLTQQAKLVANNAVTAAAQGFSVALSSDGNTAIVGGPEEPNSH